MSKDEIKRECYVEYDRMATVKVLIGNRHLTGMVDLYYEDGGLASQKDFDKAKKDMEENLIFQLKEKIKSEAL